MKNLPTFVAFNGPAVLLFSSLIGLLPLRALHRDEVLEHWQLLHAGGTSRGIMLLALAATIQFTQLSPSSRALACALVVFFVWTSAISMFVCGIIGERGSHPRGNRASKVIFYLYACGAITLPIGLAVEFVQAWT